MPDFLKKISLFNEAYLAYWVAGIILLFIIKNYLQIVIIKFQSIFVFDIATSLSSRLTVQFLNKPYGQIQKMDKGKEIQKIQMSGTDFANHILLSLNSLFTEIAVITAIAIVSFILYPKISILVFLISIVCLLLLYRIRKKKIQEISESIRKSYFASTSDLLNIIDGYLEIKSLKKEGFFQNKFKRTLERFNANFAVLKKHQNSNSKYLEVFIIIGLSLFLYYLNSNMDIISDKVLLISYIASISLKLFPSLNKVILAYTNFSSYKYTIDVLSGQSEDSSKGKDIPEIDKSISLKNIHFSYIPNSELLKDINLTIKRGEIIGIKGRSGIGKTTLLNIIMGLITPNSGSIMIDQNEITKNTSLFPFIGYVPQQPFLFQGTLLNNIVMGEEETKIDHNRINLLINAFQLQEFVSNLEEGLDTQISHDSLSVSGGQKQRIALIRALYAEPQLLILDEVSNQLDEELEAIILNYLKEYSKDQNIATVLVSHSSKLNSICNDTYKITNHSLLKI